MAAVSVNRSASLNVSGQPKLHEAPKAASHDPKRSHDSDFESGDEFNHAHDGNSAAKAATSALSPIDVNNELTLSPPDSNTEHKAQKGAFSKNYIPPTSPSIAGLGNYKIFVTIKFKIFFELELV